MSEAPKKERSLDDVHKEYSQVCANAGHLGYQIKTLKDELSMVNDRLRDLQLEGAKMQAAAKVVDAGAKQ